MAGGVGAAGAPDSVLAQALSSSSTKSTLKVGLAIISFCLACQPLLFALLSLPGMK